MAKRLLERETLTYDEVRAAIREARPREIERKPLTADERAALCRALKT